MDTSTLEELLSGLDSLLYFDEETGQPKVYHASFPDFVFNRSRSQELHMDPAHLHRDLACLIVKTLSFSPLPNCTCRIRSSKLPTDLHVLDPRLWIESFRYHSEHGAMSDDMVASTIDDINWPQFSERLDLSNTGYYGVFTGLCFLASIFIELQRYYDHLVSFLLTFALIDTLTDVMII